MKLNVRKFLTVIVTLALAAVSFVASMISRRQEVDTMVQDMIDLSGAPEGFSEELIRE